MKGYWYVIALVGLGTLLAVQFSSVFFIFPVLCWVGLLSKRNKLSISVPFLSVSLVFYILFNPFNGDDVPDSLPVSKESVVTGKISSPVTTFSKIEFTFKPDKPGKSKLLVNYFPDEKETIPASWKRGAECVMQGNLEFPETRTNPGQFDYRAYLLQKGISQRLVIDETDQVSCSGRSMLSYVDDLRQKLLAETQHRLKPETAAWMNALLFGQKQGIKEEVIKKFQEWGLSHLLAISGLHIGLLAAIFYFFLIKGNILTKEKAGTFLFSVFPFYIIIAGESPSVWRAAGMGMLALLMAKRNRKFTSLDILSIIFLLSIIGNPSNVNQLSFQFSFLVTFSLLLSRRIFTHTGSPFFQSLSVSLVSQLSILPIQIDQFYFFNSLSPLANLLFVPYFSLFVLPAMLCILMGIYLFPVLLPAMETAFLYVHSRALSLLGKFEDFYFPAVIGEIPVGFSFFYFVFFCLFMAKWEKEERKSVLKIGVILTLILVLPAVKPYLSGQGTITMLDIGQGDAVVLELPYRKGVIFIDVGGSAGADFLAASDKSYQQIIKPFLFSKGIARINTIVLTHPDMDHAGNLPYFKEDFAVGRIVGSKWLESDAEAGNVEIEKGYLPLEIWLPSHRYALNGHYFDVLSPDVDNRDPNNNSLVLKSEFGGENWIFTGDIEEATEKQLTARFPNLKADVLKVAHHGSKTSSSEGFISLIQPDTALISVGRNNRFGHPAEKTIETLARQNIRIFRTDENGAIQFFFTEKEGEFVPYLK